MTADKAISQLALIPPGTTGVLTINCLGSWVACALLGTMVIRKERLSSLYIVAFVQTTTLSLRDTLGATKQEAIITDTCLHTAFFALFSGIWVVTGGRTGIPTEFIMAVLWA